MQRKSSGEGDNWYFQIFKVIFSKLVINVFHEAIQECTGVASFGAVIYHKVLTVSATGSFWHIETKIFGPASVFLSRHR